jgi:hypothetical protein
VNPDQLRRRTYYHESGHAVASVKCGGYVKCIDLSDEVPETSTDVKRADVAFGIWAGLWAQAYWEGNCTVGRIMEIFQTQSYRDWPLYEEASDARRAAEMNVRKAASDAELADLEKDRPKPKNPPPVTAPAPSWHDELTTGWHEIERLAESLLNGESIIDLSNGQRLVRDGNRNYWSDPDAPSVEEDESQQLRWYFLKRSLASRCHHLLKRFQGLGGFAAAVPA